MWQRWRKTCIWISACALSGAAIYVGGYAWYESLPQEEQVRISSTLLYNIHIRTDAEYRYATWYCHKTPSPNYSNRTAAPIRFLVLHFTAGDALEGPANWFSNYKSSVSAHYIIGKNGECYQSVPENKVAWHAGASAWHDAGNLNTTSIGIELVNTGYDPFSEAQIQALIALSGQIMKRHNITPENVLAHSDIKYEKKDPGELFPWQRLAEHGIGLWPDAAVTPAPTTVLRLGNRGPEVFSLQQRLSKYGYFINQTGTYDHDTVSAVMAFQRHFRPERIDGQWDGVCDQRLNGLLQKIGN
ncbi:MAG: N-acetylmuramoyl-L-alanine amidase [Rickettsiales bacterium]|nr:N-acetylmuramoyl-L-alanine amidase [Rickettsiales bacterium]